MNKDDQNAEGRLLGIQKSGKAYESRIADSHSAYELWKKIKDEDGTASSYRGKIAGQINGNPPRDVAKMKRLGLGGFSNVNWREAEGIIEMNASSFWDLDMNVPNFIGVNIYDDRDLAIPDELNYGNIIAEEYTRTLKDWPEYFYNRMLSILEMLKYGFGHIFWRDKYDWHFEAMKCGTLLLPSDTKSLTKEPEMVLLRDSMRVGELYRYIETDKDKGQSEDAGWNVGEVKDAILRAQKIRPDASQKMQVPEWEALQQSIKNNDYLTNYITCNQVQITHILVREISGEKKVSHYIICEDEERNDFLYKQLGEYDSMYNTVCLFLAGVGDGYVRSVKGLGQKIYPHIEQSNNFMNHMVNTGYLAGSFMVSTSQPNAMSLTQFGPVTIFPRHAEPIGQSFMPNIDSLAKVRMLLQGIVGNNTGVFQRQIERSGPPKTAHEVNAEEIKNARLEKTQVNVHYLQLDAMHREVFRRLVNSDYPKYADGYEQAQQFKQRCYDRGVPREFLNDKRCKVYALRAIGHGSGLQRSQITAEILGVSDRFPVIGQNNALRDFVAERVGQQSVDRYVPAITMRDVPNSETSVATLENNAIVQGMATLVGADQPHPIHVPIHLQLCNEVAQAYMQNKDSGQVDVVKTYQIVLRGVEHIKQHLQFWARDPSRKAEREQAEEMAKQVEMFAKQIEPEVRKVVQAQQQQAQQQQQVAQQQGAGMSPEMQLKREEMLEGVRIKEENMRLQNELRAQREANRVELANAKAAAEIARKGMQQ
jgi:hypothetical protein